ncbi:guanylate kinase [Enterococcus faecalis]
MTNLQHKLFVIMGPSGSGKTAVSAAVFPKNYKVVSHTTRQKRAGEVDQVDYYFETKASFQTLLSAHELVEYDQYHGEYYGVGLQAILQQTRQHCAYVILTYSGFCAVAERFGDSVVPIFFDVSKANVFARLSQRERQATVIQERLQLYEQEIQVKTALAQVPNGLIIDANPSFSEVVAQLRHFVCQENKEPVNE